MLHKDFWESRWSAGQTGWDLRGVSPPLAAYIDQVGPVRRELPLLLPGAGSGYEALYLLEKGFTDITVLDIAPTAVELLRERLERDARGWDRHLRLICGDFFEHRGQYALILEQTFFCALDPELREAYVRRMHALLRPGGHLAGVLFDREFDGGPPFGGSAAEYRALFEPLFTIKTLERCTNSYPARQGTEVFFIAVK